MAAFDQLPDLRLQERTGHLSSVAPDLSNQDWNNYLYTDSDGGKVIFDEQGPGVIYRLHITLQNESDADAMQVMVYLDGATTPQIDETIAQMGAGTGAPFLSPLVEDPTVGSGGYTYYLPIPYAKSARVSLNGTQAGVIYWQTDWQSFPPGTPVQTWTGSEDSGQVRSLWSNAGSYPDPQPGDVSQSGTAALPGDGGTTQLADLDGPQEITAITMKIPGVDPTRGAHASVLDDTHIRIYWDNEATPSVDAPLGSFFGMGYFGAAPTRDVAMGMLDDGTMYSYFPMPFQHSARIELVNAIRGSGDKPVPGVTYTITHRPFTGSFSGIGYFRTAWTPQTIPPGQQAHRVHWLDVSGAGQVVGIVESRISDPPSGTSQAIGIGFLEGNVNMWVDGSETPAWRDNGTEDTFDGGYYFDQGPVENPNTGDNIRTDDSIAAYRTFIGDAIPFRNHITITDQPGGPFYPYYDTDYPLVLYYSQTPRMVQSDSFSVGNATAAAQHQYQATGQTNSYSLTSTYDGYLHPPQVTGQVNAQQGSSQFVLRISPQNQGVVLRRTYDQANGRQAAGLYVDGTLVGRWYQAYGNDVSRWAQDDFTIPAADTRGKNSITVQLRWVTGSPAWTEAGYASYSIEPPPADGQFHVTPSAGSVAVALDPTPALVDGTPGVVTGTFYNSTNAPLGNVRYQLAGAPAGWQVTPAGRQPAVLAAHAAVRLAWKVTVHGTPATEPALTLHVGYDTTGGPAATQSGPQATSTVPPVLISSFAATPQTVQPGQQTTFQVQLRNQTSAPQSGNLTISGPSGWTVTPATQPYSLAAGAEQSFTAATTNPGIQGTYLTFTASTTYAGGQPSDQADAILITPGGAQAYCAVPSSDVACTFDSQGNLNNVYSCGGDEFNSPNLPVAEVVNGCVGRVWLHEFPYPEFTTSGWAYCVSPGATVDIPADDDAPQNVQVTTNTSAC
jgi:hypothetical protein